MMTVYQCHACDTTDPCTFIWNEEKGNIVPVFCPIDNDELCEWEELTVPKDETNG